MTVASSNTAPSSSKGLNIALWVVQAMLAFAFGMAGFMKSTTPLDQLAVKMAWVGYTPGAVVRFIGVCELLGAIGLIVPAATRIKPQLTPLAAVGLVTIMVLAAGVHTTHGEAAVTPVNFVIGALAAFVAWGRFKKAPIQPRS